WERRRIRNPDPDDPVGIYWASPRRSVADALRENHLHVRRRAAMRQIAKRRRYVITRPHRRDNHRESGRHSRAHRKRTLPLEEAEDCNILALCQPMAIG